MPPRPAVGGWITAGVGVAPVLESRTRGAAESWSADRAQPGPLEPVAVMEPMELGEEAPPPGGQWDKARGRTATETVQLPLGPQPHVRGGMATQAITAARREELGLVERAPALDRAEKVAVGSSVAWAKMMDEEDLRDRGRAEATERKALAKTVEVLEARNALLAGQLQQVRAERDELHREKVAAEKQRVKSAPLLCLTRLCVRRCSPRVRRPFPLLFDFTSIISVQGSIHVHVYCMNYTHHTRRTHIRVYHRIGRVVVCRVPPGGLRADR